MSEPPRFNNPAPDPVTSAAELQAMREMGASRGLKVIRLLSGYPEEEWVQYAAIIEPATERSDVWIWGSSYELPDEGIIVADAVLVKRREEREKRPPRKGYDLYFVGDQMHLGKVVAHMEGRALKVADKHLGQMTNDEYSAVFRAAFEQRMKDADDS